MARTLAIWLDGFDMALADRWELPHLSALAARSTTATLDNGTAHLTGLSGEHLVSGLDPMAARRASAVRFDPATYRCRQEPALVPTALGGVPTVVLDPCYLDLDAAPEAVVGLTDWGAHDPGGPQRCRPADLHDEVERRFGAYPASPWLYATPWGSPARCARMGEDLTTAVQRRAEIARWLVTERLPDWELALVGVSEAHSASEGLFHGADPAHPLAAVPSAAAAGRALRSVYQAIDDLVGELVAATPGAVHVVFSLHGMGTNTSDVPSMVLLGELLRRWSGDPTPDAAFALDDHGVPLLDAGRSWHEAVLDALAPPPSPHQRVGRRLPGPVRRVLVRARDRVRPGSTPPPRPLGWMPVTRHGDAWPTMAAFAIPSFYDGRVRVNVRGREADGVVDPDDYGTVLDEVEALLRACREPRTGRPVVAAVERVAAIPFEVDDTDADLVVHWAPDVLGVAHDELGTIGPLPMRRTGGHASPIGRCLVHDPDRAARDLGPRSSFDVLPTLLDLAGQPVPAGLSGSSMLDALGARAV